MDSVRLTSLTMVVVAILAIMATVLPASDVGAQDDSSASISGLVFDDSNGNGVRDQLDPPVAGVIVYVRDSAGVVAGSDITDGQGQYLVGALASGDYQVQFVAIGRDFTLQDASVDDSVDSDVDPATGLTAPYTLEPGDEVTSVDAGLVQRQSPLASIGDFVFVDSDSNGIQDPDEGGVAGVQVEVIDDLGNVAGTAITDTTGNYVVADLAPGTYFVRFDLPGTLLFTLRDVGDDDARDSDVDPVTGETDVFQLGVGEDLTTIDAGVEIIGESPPSSIGDFVFADTNLNGLQDLGEAPFPGVRVEVLNNVGIVVGADVTDAAGAYVIGGLRAGFYSVRFVPPGEFPFAPSNVGDDDSLDSDADPLTGETAPFALGSGENLTTIDAGLIPFVDFPRSVGDFVFFDVNGNGVQDPEEPGVSGVRVELVNSAGLIVATSVTDSDGRYLVLEVLPDTYTARFVLPGNLNFTQVNVGADDSLDSDADPITGETEPFTIDSSQNLTVDAGVIGSPGTLGAIGDFVFLDSNANGLQDADEIGVEGVEVYAFNEAGIVVASDITDADGVYVLSPLLDGEYDLQFVPPGGLSFTTPDVGLDDSIDSDADPSTGFLDTINLARDQVITSSDVGLVLSSPLGDVNCDGFTNIVDALLISLYTVEVLGAVETCLQFGGDVIVASNGDVDANGETNIVDALLIAQCDAALNNVLCPAP